MDKKSFFTYFNCNNEKLISFLYDKFQISHTTGKDIFINEFLTLNIYSSLKEALSHTDVKLRFWSFYDQCEKYLVVLYVDNMQKNFPASILKVSNKSKFHILLHRDYLGAIMSLGIRREKLGDLVVKANECYVPILNEVSQYVWNNLNYIGKCPCDTEILDLDSNEIPKIELDEISIITTSMRVDCVVSSLIKNSRSKSCNLIQGGKVLINYLEEYKKDRILKFNDIVTVRGVGKFKIGETFGNTQKDKIKLKVLKFV